MPWTDEQVESAVGVLLRVGVVASATVVLAGGIWYFSTAGIGPVHYQLFRGEPAGLRGPAGVIRGLLARDPRSVIQFGLLLLIATPIARVAFAMGAFALQKDWTYVAIAAIVLAALLYGLAGS